MASVIELIIIGAIGGLAGFILAWGLSKISPNPAQAEIDKLKFQSPAERVQTAKKILKLQLPHALIMGPLVAIIFALVWYAIATVWIFIAGV